MERPRLCYILVIVNVVIFLTIIGLYIVCPFIFTYKLISSLTNDNTICTCEKSIYNKNFIIYSAVSNVENDLNITMSILETFNNNTYSLGEYTQYTLNEIHTNIQKDFANLVPYINSVITQPSQMKFNELKLYPNMYTLCGAYNCYLPSDEICLGVLTVEILNYMLAGEIILIILSLFNLCITCKKNKQYNEV